MTAAVLTGQLSIGWSNDLVDARRDRAVGRTDKPLAAGAVTERVVRAACAAALAACVVLSLACGWASGLVHLLLGVASGWAYNLWSQAHRALPAAVCRRVRRAAGRRHARPRPTPSGRRRGCS